MLGSRVSTVLICLLGAGSLAAVMFAAAPFQTTPTAPESQSTPSTAVATPARITLSANPGSTVGEALVLRGRVRGTGRASDKTILLQRRHSDAWRTTDRLRRQDDGRYRFRVRNARAGSHRYRTVVERHGVRLDDSPARTVRVIAPPDPLTVWAVGDMCDNDNEVPGCGEVAGLVAGDSTTSYFAPLGDLQYDRGTLPEFATYYHPKVGARLNAVTRPVPGNHEYETANAAGYFSYFGAAAGDPNKGYYSVTDGNWRLIFLNSNCNQIAAGCNYTSAQAKWLDLQLQGPETCEIVFTHHPPISDGSSEAEPSGAPSMRSFLRHAYENYAELFVSGHHHSYQRFSPRNMAGVPVADGVVSIVSGVGGEEFAAFAATNRSEYRQNTQHGALRLSLSLTDYSGAFVNIDGATMDSFSGSCRA